MAVAVEYVGVCKGDTAVIVLNGNTCLVRVVNRRYAVYFKCCCSVVAINQESFLSTVCDTKGVIDGESTRIVANDKTASGAIGNACAVEGQVAACCIIINQDAVGTGIGDRCDAESRVA